MIVRCSFLFSLPHSSRDTSRPLLKPMKSGVVHSLHSVLAMYCTLTSGHVLLLPLWSVHINLTGKPCTLSPLLFCLSPTSHVHSLFRQPPLLCQPLIFRNTLLSDHNSWPFSKATETIIGVFKSVPPVDKVEILSFCL